MSNETIVLKDQESSEPSKSRKWYYVAAGAIVVIIAGIVAIMIFVVNPRIATNKGDSSSSAPSNTPITIDPNDKECSVNPSLSRLEPENGNVLLGFHLDWEGNGDLPGSISRKLGLNPAVYNAFLILDPSKPPETAVRYEHFDWHAEQVQKTGGMLAVTIEPVQLSLITDAHYMELAKRCVKANSQYGVPLFLRLGHEMNGK